MPESDDSQCRRGELNVEAGFHWLPNRYGPPPGVSRRRLARIESQTDDEFVRDVLGWSLEARVSLMIGERYRRRTFNARGYPRQAPVNVDELAAEGFFWTGQSDRSMCAFCSGTLGNWERGDPPVSQQHRRFFPYCKRAQRKPCPNVPVSFVGEGKDSSSSSSSYLANNAGGVITADAVLSNVDPDASAALTNQAYHKRYQVYGSRLGSYKGWKLGSHEAPTIHSLCEAGFYYEGVGDKVRCFWCDGALENWVATDDPWREHAYWYPGCRHAFLVKGGPYIAKVQLTVSDEDRETISTLSYNNAGTRFLSEIGETGESREINETNDNVVVVVVDVDPAQRVRREDWYVVLNGLGFDDEELVAVARERDWRLDSVDIATIVDVLLARRAGDSDDRAFDAVPMDVDVGEASVGGGLEDLVSQLQKLSLTAPVAVKDGVDVLVNRLRALDINAQAAIAKRLPIFLDFTKIIRAAQSEGNIDDDDDDDDDDGLTELNRDELIASAGTCVECLSRPRNTVTLPCGHWIYCSDCVATDSPSKCLVCGGIVRGTCRVFFA
jgi:hypothetical protein